MRYKNQIIEKNVYGYYVTFVFNVGYLKADSIDGIKKLIKEYI